MPVLHQGRYDDDSSAYIYIDRAKALGVTLQLRYSEPKKQAGHPNPAPFCRVELDRWRGNHGGSIENLGDNRQQGQVWAGFTGLAARISGFSELRAI